MAYLISDMAAGSNAALTMQQNMAAAPYVKDQAAATAEETQLKLQQDRIKAQYAGQEAQAKLQQEQQDLEKSKLNNIVLKNNLVAKDSAKQAVQQATSSPEYKSAVASGDDIGAAKILNRAVLNANGDPVEFFKNELGIETEAARVTKAKAAEADLNSQNLYRAISSINSIPEEQLGQYIDQLPKQTVQSTIAAVGEANWAKATPEQRKEMLMGQMHSGASQIVAQRIDGVRQNVEAVTTRVIKVAKINAAARIQAKTIGETGANTRAANDPLKANKLDLAVERLYGQSERTVNESINSELRPLRKELEDLESTNLQERLSGKTNPATSANVSRVQAKMMEVLKKQHDQLLVAAKRLPESDAKQRALAELGVVAAHVTPDKPKEAPAPSKPADTKPAAVTSNKSAADKPITESEFNTKWASLAAGQSLVGPDGKTYTKK